MISSAILFFLSLFYLMKSSDLVVKQISLYLLAYVIFVVASNEIFGADFSSKSGVFQGGVNQISFMLILFYVPFICVLGTRKHWTRIEVPMRARYSLKEESVITFFMMPFLIFLIWYLNEKGFRITGRFMEYAGVRNTLVDYFYIYFVVMLSIFQRSRLMLLFGLVGFLAHFVAAERMRAFVYIITIGMHYYGLQDRKNLSSLFLLSGFIIAEFIGTMRHGDMLASSDYNVTHFGSVTVSSLYILDYSSTLDFIDRFRFLLGSVAANIIPSSLVPDSYNLRYDILNYADIPGGGWLPIFYYVFGSLIYVPIMALVISISYRLISSSLMKSHKPELYALLLTFAATTSRWFMYTPYQVFKMPLYAFVLTYIIHKIVKAVANAKSA